VPDIFKVSLQTIIGVATYCKVPWSINRPWLVGINSMIRDIRTNNLPGDTEGSESNLLGPNHATEATNKNSFFS